MSIAFRFRVSLYLTLALASTCLGVAVQPLLPGIAFVVVPVLAFLLVAFFLEGRWSLPIWTANLMGLVIAIGWAVWIDYRLFESTNSWQETIPLAAAILPDIGPLLIVLVLVKLFRPKQRSDWWGLFGLGLLEVALGCVLDSGPLFGALLLVYLTCALWCLGLLNALGPGLEAPVKNRIPGAIRWAFPVIGVGLVLFLLLPRFGEDAWDPLRLLATNRRQNVTTAGLTGAVEQIDLNRTGWVEVDDQVALVVTAEDAAGAPKLDLRPEQRWRGKVLDEYEHGRWASGYAVPLPINSLRGSRRGFGAVFPPENPPRDMTVPRMAEPRLFDLGPRQYFLTFELEPHKAGGLFLSDPVVLLLL